MEQKERRLFIKTLYYNFVLGNPLLHLFPALALLLSEPAGKGRSRGPRGSFLPEPGQLRGCWAVLFPLRELQPPGPPPGQLSQDHTHCRAKERKLLMDANGAVRISRGAAGLSCSEKSGEQLTGTSRAALAVALRHPSGLQLQQIRAEEDLQLQANRGGRWVGKSEASATSAEDLDQQHPISSR